uniref:Protein HIRA n=1 Tax=Rhabditophanes sp. KR3021 TaxID=114890 RepID=A0AC35UEW0_9BILA
MNIQNCSWITNKGKRAYGIDIHPSGSKFACCSQNNEGKGAVDIWSMNPIKTKTYPPEGSHPLHTTTYKSGLNCCRWSIGDAGKYLAVATDENTCLILTQTAHTILDYSGGKRRQEMYKTEQELRGHTAAVNDCEWSPDGRFLATSSLDCNIVIWNVVKWDKVKVLSKASGGHTDNVNGISWDPMGSYFASQSSDRSLKIWATDDWSVKETITKPFKGCCNSTMFKRSGWSPDGSILIATGGSNNTAPSAQIIIRKNWSYGKDLIGFRQNVTVAKFMPILVNCKDDNDDVTTVMICAIGSRDRSFSLWMFPKHDRPLCVLRNLFTDTIQDISWHQSTCCVSSSDGKVKVITLRESENMKFGTIDELRNRCQLLYKTIPVQYRENQQTDSSDGVIEDSVLICEVPTHVEMILPVEEVIVANNTPTIQPKEIVEAEKPKEIPAPPTMLIAKSKKGGHVAVSSSLIVKETIVPTPPSQTRILSQSAKISLEALTELQKFQKPALTSEQLNSLVDLMHKRLEDKELFASEEVVHLDSEKEIASPNDGPKKKPVGDKRQHLFKSPGIKKILSVANICQGNVIDQVQSFNDMPPVVAGMRLVKTIARNSRSSIWSCFTEDRVCLIAFNELFTVIGSLDNCISIFNSKSGSQLNRMVKPSLVCKIILKGEILLIITQKGVLTMYDLSKMQQIMEIKLKTIIKSEDDIDKIELSRTNFPLIRLKNKTVYTYCEDTKDFIKIWGDFDKVALPTMKSIFVKPDYLGTDMKSRGLIPNIISTIEDGSTNIVEDEVLQSSIEQTLETLFTASRIIRDYTDFKDFLNQYLLHLAENKNYVKISAVLEQIESVDTICGQKTSEILKEVESYTNLIREKNKKTGSTLMES